jgi:hypothetical protein
VGLAAVLKNYSAEAMFSVFMDAAISTAVRAALKLKSSRQPIVLTHPPWMKRRPCQGFYHIERYTTTSPDSSCPPAALRRRQLVDQRSDRDYRRELSPRAAWRCRLRSRWSQQFATFARTAWMSVDDIGVVLPLH